MEARILFRQTAACCGNWLKWRDNRERHWRRPADDTRDWGTRLGRKSALQDRGMAPGLTTQAAVIGAGPVGLTAALALCALGIEVVIAAPAYDAGRAETDQRTTALLPGSI